MKKLKFKMILIFSLITVICLAGSMIIVLQITRSRVDDLNNTKYSAVSSYYAAEISEWLDRETAVVDNTVDYFESLDTLDESVAWTYLMKLTEQSSCSSDIYAGFTDTLTFLDGSGWVPDEGWDFTTRSWYTLAMASDEKIYGSPYLDANTGNMALAVSKKFTLKDGSTGVVSMDVSLANLFTAINEIIDTSDGSYLIVVNDEGNILLHDNESYMATEEVTYSYSDVLDGMSVSYEDALSGEVFKDYDGVQKYVVDAEVSASGWKALVVTPKSVYNAIANKLIRVFLVCILVAAAFAALVIALFSNTITKPITSMEADVDKLSKLDMAITDTGADVLSKDEIGQMQLAIQDMRMRLNEIVRKIVGVTETLVEQFNSVDSSVRKTVEENATVKGTLSEVTTTISDVANQIALANENLVDFSAELNHIAENMDTIKARVNDAVSKTEDGMASIDVLAENIKENSRLQQAAGVSVGNLEEKSVSIDGISQTISNIATQTALLSLNASIEAARAGEAGKGFAVVAQEISKLASETSSATGEITSIINEIKNEIGNVTNQMQIIQNNTDDCMSAMATSEDLFKQINTNITDVGDNINDLNKAVDSLNSNKDMIVDKVSGISAETEELTASSQEMFEMIEEENEDTQSIQVAVTNLDEVITKLNAIVESFTI